MKKILLLNLVFLFSLTKTIACGCSETNESLSKKVEKAFSESDLIIRGKVIDLKIVNTGKHKSSTDPIIYKFEITKVHKGNPKIQIIEITSAESEASCGYKFEFGKSYLVYASKSTYYPSKTNNKFDYVTSLCNRNEKLKNVNKKELRKLEKLNYKNKK